MRLVHVEGAVLVGGPSSRMGRDKASLDWDGVPMAERAVRALSTCLARVRVVTRRGARSPGNLDRIEDHYPEQASMVGLHAALAACEASAVLVTACDLPEIEPRLLTLLLGLVPAEAEADIVAPLGPHGPEPLLAIYRPRLLPEVARRIEAGNLSLRSLLEDSRTVFVPEPELRQVDPELRSFRNVNTPGDLETGLRGS